MDQLTLGHPRWPEFIGRLEQRLNFREQSDEPGKYQWLCGKDGDPFAYTREGPHRDGPPTEGFPRQHSQPAACLL